MRRLVEYEGVPVNLSVSFGIKDGKLVARFLRDTTLLATLDMTDKNNWCVLDSAILDGEVFAQAEGTYIGGHLGSHEHNIAPEGAEVEDITVYLGANIVTSMLSDEDMESIHDELVERGGEE